MFKMRNMFKSSVDSKRLMLVKGENTEAVFLDHREGIECTEQRLVVDRHMKLLETGKSTKYRC